MQLSSPTPIPIYSPFQNSFFKFHSFISKSNSPSVMPALVSIIFKKKKNPQQIYLVADIPWITSNIIIIVQVLNTECLSTFFLLSLYILYVQSFFFFPTIASLRHSVTHLLNYPVSFYQPLMFCTVVLSFSEVFLFHFSCFYWLMTLKHKWIAIKLHIY